MSRGSMVVFLAAAALTGVPAASTAKSADERATAGSGTASMWISIAHWPDFTTGMWAPENPRPSTEKSGDDKRDGAGGAGRLLPGARASPPAISLTSDAQARRAALTKGTESQGADCLPSGPFVARIIPTALYYAGDAIFIFTSGSDLQVRRVIMNHKVHGDPDPSWSGHSLGHWEGETLVIDTVAFSPTVKLFDLPASGGMHLVERIRLLSPDQLEWRYTVTDPEILAAPWEFRTTLKRHKDWEIQPASCAENNRDKRNEDGTAAVDLTPKE